MPARKLAGDDAGGDRLLARLVRVLFGAIALLTVIVNFSTAQEPSIRIARLIERLGSSDFSERHAADQELSQLGSPVRPQLQAALKNDNTEVRLRAARLLDRLNVSELWLPRTVTLAAKKEQASTVLAKIAAQTGNHVLAGDQYGSFQDEVLTLDFADTPYWEAVDTICRVTGNHMRPHYDATSPGIVLTTGGPPKYPTAYAGPLRALITGGRRVFIEELDHEDHSATVTHTFQLNLQLAWEDRFRLIGYVGQPEVLEARTDTGVLLAATPPQSTSWNVVAPGTRHISGQLRLSPPPTAAAALDTLKLRWSLIALGEMAELDVAKLEVGKQYHQNELTLCVEKVEHPAGGRFDLVALVARDIAMPEHQEILFHENMLALFDAGGKALRVQSQSSSLTERGLEMKLSLVSDTSDSPPERLKLIYPRQRTRRDLEIVFRGIPLPHSQPQ